MKINIADCSWKQLVSLAKKCCFYTYEGEKHTRVEDKEGNVITTIPRHTCINRETAKGIIKDFKKAGCHRKEIAHI